MNSKEYWNSLDATEQQDYLTETSHPDNSRADNLESARDLAWSGTEWGKAQQIETEKRAAQSMEERENRQLTCKGCSAVRPHYEFARYGNDTNVWCIDCLRQKKDPWYDDIIEMIESDIAERAESP